MTVYTDITLAYLLVLAGRPIKTKLSMSGGSSGLGGPANFHPQRNISGFVDLALEGATAPAGKNCAGVGL